MIVPFILLLISVSGIGAAVALPGLSDLLLLAVPFGIASAYLLLRAYLPLRSFPRRDADTDPSQKPMRQGRSPFARHKPKHIVIDGPNVMRWKDGIPEIDAVREVLEQLKQHGFTSGEVFDANAGHLLTDRYQHHGGMGKLLGLPEDRVMVVDKGTPADPTILAAARDLGAQIVTNDRYKDWAKTHPEVRKPGHLIRGHYEDGKLWLDLPEVAG